MACLLELDPAREGTVMIRRPREAVNKSRRGLTCRSLKQGGFQALEPFPGGAAGALQLAAGLVDRGVVAAAEMVADLREGPPQELAGQVEAGLPRLGGFARAAERVDLRHRHAEVLRR